MLGYLAILALSNSGGNFCCCPRQCCSNRELPTFVPARGTAEFAGPNGAVFDIDTLVPTPGFTEEAQTVIVPLDEFTNLKNVLPAIDGLEITRDGLYEISYNMDLQFDQPGANLAVYAQVNGSERFAQTGVTLHADTTVQTAFNTARIALAAGDVVTLAISVFDWSLFTILPGAALTVKRIG